MPKQINSTSGKLSSLVTKLVTAQQARSLTKPIGINKKVKQIKKWIPAIFLLIFLLQAPVLAQTEPPTPTNGQASTPEVVTPPATPDATPILLPLKGTEQISLQLVNCGGWIGMDCALARLLLPASASINQRELQFDNSTQSPVDVLNSAVVVQGDLTGYQLNQKAIALPDRIKPLPANQIVNIPLTLDRSVMPPDQYSGAVILTLKNRGDRLSLPINLSARSGPLVPIIVLFFGVVLGRLFKYMQDRGEPQAKALEDVYRLQADITAAQLEDRDKQLLAAMAKEVQTLVSREKLEVVPAQVQTIRDRLDTLVKLQSLEDQLNEQAATFPTDVDTFTLDIRKARLYIAQREDAKAKELLEKISTDLASVGSRGAGGAGVEAFSRSLTETASAILRIGESSSVIVKQTGNFQRFMVTLSGVSDRARAEATFWIVRPLLSLVLLVGLSAVGLGSLYVENGTTFGARPFADYLGLILWGLSADVASRSLSSLKGGND